MDHDVWLTRARRIADDVLFPQAPAVDEADRVPAAHLDLLAAEGFYGVAVSAPDPADIPFELLADVVATLAGGDLSTTFVWLQHLAPIIAIATQAGPDDRERWLAPMADGRVRSGIAMSGIRPGTARLRVRAVPGGFRLTGETAWVTGWGMVDILLVGAVDEQDVVHFLLMDARAADTLTAAPTRLLAVQASGTVSLRFADHFVPAERLGRTVPYAEWASSDAGGSSLNGFLALGVAGRCARLLADAPGIEPDLHRRIVAARADLLTAAGDEVPGARAQASLLAARSATALMVHAGSRAVLSGRHAGRLYREAGFLLVFGSRPAIKANLLGRLSASLGPS